MNNSKRQKLMIMAQIYLIVTTAGIFTSEIQAGMMLRFGHYASKDDPISTTAIRFRELIEQNLGVGIEIHPEMQLGTIQGMVELVRQGSIDITLVPSTLLRRFAPKMGVLDLPFLFMSHEQAYRVLDAGSRTCQQLLDELEQQNMKGMAFWEIGFRNLSTSNREITHSRDLKGLRFRVTSNPALIRAFDLLGATAIQIPYGELYLALKANVLDGQEGTINNFYMLRLYEVQRYLSLTRHAYTASVLVMNLNRFRNLSQRQQNGILEVARDAAKYGRRRNKEIEDKNINRFRNRGLRVLENFEWGERRDKVWDETRKRFIEENGLEGERMLDQIISER